MEIKIKGIYNHFNGDYYIVEDLAINSETLEIMVIYRALYGESKLWVSFLSDFTYEVNKNGQGYRFELQEIKSQNN